MKISIVLHVEIPTNYTPDDIKQMTVEITRYVNREMPEGETVVDTETITEPVIP